MASGIGENLELAKALLQVLDGLRDIDPPLHILAPTQGSAVTDDWVRGCDKKVQECIATLQVSEGMKMLRTYAQNCSADFGAHVTEALKELGPLTCKAPAEMYPELIRAIDAAEQYAACVDAAQDGGTEEMETVVAVARIFGHSMARRSAQAMHVMSGLCGGWCGERSVCLVGSHCIGSHQLRLLPCALVNIA